MIFAGLLFFIAQPAPLSSATDSLVGAWTFVSDSDGATADTGTVISLNFSAGSVGFSAIGPGQNVTDSGTWSASGNRITVNLPAIGKAATNQPYTLAANSLTLPFKVFSDGAGSSIWIRLVTSSNNGNASSSGSSGNSGNSKNQNNSNNSNNSSNSNSSNNSNNPGNSNNSNNSGNPNDPSNSNNQNNQNDPNNPNNPNDPNNPNNPNDPNNGIKPPKPQNMNLRDMGKPKPDSPYAPFVGDWVGEGWSWETRFRQSKKQFASQLTHGMTSAIDTREGIDGTVMEVIVEHATHFAFTIDSSGQVTGKGGIVYNVVPNLCGLAALTKQVNQAVNMMGKLPSIYKFANELGTAAIKSYNSEWVESENRLKDTMESLMEDVSKVKSPVPGVGVPYTSQKELEGNLARAFENMGESKDTRALALQTLMLRCGGGGSNSMVGGIPCSIITSPAVEAEMGSIAKEIGKQSQDILLDKLNDVAKDAMAKLNRVEKHEETACGQIGPGTLEQFKTEMTEKFSELGKEEAKGALIGGLLGYAAGNISTGVAGGLSVPVDMMLSIPGVTQVTYWYKGIDDGPKHEDQAKRKYNMEGHVDATGGSPKLYLTMDELTGGPNSLTVKYMVNYKWDQGKFPAFSPFLEKPGEMHVSGDVVIPPSSLPGPETPKGKGAPPVKVAKSKTEHMTAPYAVFHQTGTHRNGVNVWQEYEYYWFVHKVTEPTPPAK